MEGLATQFQSHRARLFGVAYRMLGSRADAEDVLQDAWLRWHEADVSTLESPEAWLVTVVTRLCLDRLRTAKQDREHYIGPWLPEPILTDTLPSPELQLEMQNEVSVAFLALLDRLGPEKRAAFLLKEVFDYDYPEIAEMLGKAGARATADGAPGAGGSAGGAASVRDGGGSPGAPAGKIHGRGHHWQSRRRHGVA